MFAGKNGFKNDTVLCAPICLRSWISWEAIKDYLQAGAFAPDLTPAAVISTQSFGDFPDKFHPHLHMLCADGLFTDEGDFVLAARFNGNELKDIFRHKMLKMLLAKGKITQERIAMMEQWTHSGFNVYCGPPIIPDDTGAMETLAAYIIRASFSQKRMDYLPESGIAHREFLHFCDLAVSLPIVLIPRPQYLLPDLFLTTAGYLVILLTS